MNDWKSYKNWISDTIKIGSQFYFRGQKCSEWKLQTSFHRYAEKSGVTLMDYLKRIVPEVQYIVCSAQNELIDISTNRGLVAFLLDYSITVFLHRY